jgi:hypothetical protein
MKPVGNGKKRVEIEGEIRKKVGVLQGHHQLLEKSISPAKRRAAMVRNLLFY